MKKFLSTLLIVFFATSLMAQQGLTCNDPIPVNSNYVGRVDGPCTLWYTAWSYDLPLSVHFIPDVDDSSWGPEVVVDFTCTPGEYSDPKLDSLLTLVEDFDVSFPVEFMCNLVTPNGKNEWNLSINQNYREIIAEYGITENIQAFVKVIFEEAGVVSLRPDTAFQACINNTPKVILGDTIEILPNDSNSAYVFPYTDWQEDSIRFVWVGDEPARVHLATVDCEFVLAENNGFIWNRIDLVKGIPHKLYSERMKEDIKKNKAGGLYYGKVVSPSGGKFVVEKIPMNTAKDGAILLEYGKTVQLAANDTGTLYCFPRTWESTHFVAPTDYILTMYASPSYDFGFDSEDCYIYTFSKGESGRFLSLSSTEMSAITSMAKDDYIYVRFACKSPVSITPEAWETTECADQSTLIRPNEAFFVFERSSKTIFRLRYADWVGYDMAIVWDGNVKLPAYIADACSYTLSPNNSHVLKYAEIKSGGTLDINAATIESWASRVDEDGYLYVRFNPSKLGVAIFTSSKPADTDPVDPCVAASILLEPVDALTINLQGALAIYRIDYAAWVASGVQLQWTGAGDLHTFVAKDCDFAVAKYHMDVVHYDNVAAAALPTNAELWEAFKPYYNSYYGLSRADQPIDKVATFAAAKMQEIMTDPASEYKWLGDYIQSVAGPLDGESAWRWHVHAFFNCNDGTVQGNQKIATADFSQAGQPEAWGALYSKPQTKVLDLSGLEQYVSPDGYLYVRFLTEFEGELTTVLAE